MSLKSSANIQFFIKGDKSLEAVQALIEEGFKLEGELGLRVTSIHSSFYMNEEKEDQSKKTST